MGSVTQRQNERATPTNGTKDLASQGISVNVEVSVSSHSSVGNQFSYKNGVTAVMFWNHTKRNSMPLGMQLCTIECSIPRFHMLLLGPIVDISSGQWDLAALPSICDSAGIAPLIT
jgi:hypothetical protein